MIRNTPHSSVEAATIPLLPARRSFLMVDRDFVTSELYASVACRTVIYPPPNPALPSI